MSEAALDAYASGRRAPRPAALARLWSAAQGDPPAAREERLRLYERRAQSGLELNGEPRRRRVALARLAHEAEPENNELLEAACWRDEEEERAALRCERALEHGDEDDEDEDEDEDEGQEGEQAGGLLALLRSR